MKFRAAVLVESHHPLEVLDLELPLLRFGQVLVRVICSGVCGAQINEIDAVKEPDAFLPHLLGHEATAEVIEVGEGVTTAAVGDRVVCHWRKGAGLQAPTPRYASARGPINAGWVTTFNELAIVSENRVTRVPFNFDPEVGALMGCAVTTAIGVVNNDASLRIGQSIAIFGAGGVGSAIVQAAAMVSAHPIVAVDLYDHKLDLARTCGATHVLNGTHCDPEAEIRALVGQQGVDVAVENTGRPEVIETAYRITSAAGRTVLVGVPTKGQEPRIQTLPLHFDKVLTGSHGGDSLPHLDIPRYVRLVEAGKLRLQHLVSRRYQLEQINEAIEDLRAGRPAGRCMLHMIGTP